MEIKKLVIASHNQGKVSEIREMLKPYGVEVVSAGELNLPDVEETETTFEGNATLKAVELSKLSGLPCLADDSGLCVDALGGRPGVYSARYAPNRDFDKGMDKLLAELADANLKNPSRKAHFVCCLALALPGTTESAALFKGFVDGQIATEKAGSNGFGFDPLFVPDEGDGRTFAQMSHEEKDKISHRGRALGRFVKEIFAN
ncbi:MAG: RdgB/HAM1 family non-canonical purine NTP pyrophosphatase [Alphaproteobacteria bacterium]|nr:RdgB/HAM1 family non-canonical purine NTP pyrophosphatase [Alphaproteobacteria bacterium]